MEPSELLKVLVDLVGIEPTTSSMPWKRAPSCATGPLFMRGQLLWFNSRLASTRRQTLPRTIALSIQMLDSDSVPQLG